jgi:Flp pilus assembly protein TadD
MKQQHIKSLVAMVLTGMVLAACGGLGKMAKYAENIKYNVDPNPLIVRGDSVELSINGNFPGKYFSRKAMVELTPKLEYAGGVTPYKMVAFQGDKAAGNATVVPYATGKNFVYNDKVAYTASMQNSELMLHILGKEGKKERAFDPVKLADGVITTPYLVISDDKPILSAHGYTRVTNHKADATINYLVNSSVVRPEELKDADITALAKLLKDHAKNEAYRFNGATITAYASPEGELSLNENLASDRAKSASRAVGDIMNRNKMKYDAAKFFNLMPKGEDWDGFRTAMQASNIADKQLILRILEMYNDNAKREQEIRNLAATFVEIADKILPGLRRSEITLNYEIVGRTDEEILAAVRSAKPEVLNVKEMLYAATLTNDMNEQLAIYTKASQVYPNDYRTFNNLGVVYLKRNDLGDAAKAFQKANDVKESPEVNNNLAIIARLNGDRKKAMGLLNKAAGAGNEVNYNMGIIDIQNGNYASALQNMQNYNTFNKALAQVLSGSNDAARTTLGQSPEKDSAAGHYLAAIIAARSNDGASVSSSLQKAFAIDASLKAKAQKDLEFRKFPDAVK